MSARRKLHFSDDHERGAVSPATMSVDLTEITCGLPAGYNRVDDARNCGQVQGHPLEPVLASWT